jgi:hypothetical protein
MRVAHRESDGFTLIEVVVALGLSMVTIASAAELMVMALRSAHESRERTSAAVLASTKLEELLGAPWGDASLIASPADALQRDIPGWSDVVDVQGHDAAHLSSASFVRRWRIRELAAASPLLVVTVAVASERRVSAARGTVDFAIGAPDAVIVTSVKAAGAF